MIVRMARQLLAGRMAHAARLGLADAASFA
jgi:hypothetical protein